MPAAGDPVLASDVLRARPRIIWDNATSALPASSSVVAIPGISIGFTTETAGAELHLDWFTQAQATAAGTTANITARPLVTGPSGFSQDAAVFSTYDPESSGASQATVGNSWSTTLGAAGAYTVTLRGTTAANQAINVYSTLRAMILEQFA